MKVTKQEKIEKKQTAVRQILEPIILNISWAEISRVYFGKSRAWLYQKFTGYDGHSATDFSDDEREVMKNSLYDLASKITQCADKL